MSELDLCASYLSIALARLYAPPPEGDPYALPGVSDAHRDAIKHWFVLFWQLGKPPQTWPASTPPAVRAGLQPGDITGPVFTRYPVLNDITRVLPEEVIQQVPPHLRHWAVGQYLMGVEASIIRHAIGTPSWRPEVPCCPCMMV
ncbi:hypothetical protein AA103196_2172 [Ameyamaea chiangmaiensis NBRC 103196]|uniref:Uncharacterized protein n=1 Tax=Ameyamaea chiangmaiensis TaxID=442969 RepID=A0A850P8G0_9PROT|nr:hypothetical protein [Ameyamaea chiangmaiensis]MBS4075569.1 hypothetical protein [Ameyamaea chiangmaiensis]NVN40254.1 hypothetical protein [Ameyamaea chiangmaiensis]GBQ69295.1 hypothetical protein AA103196_2172 [Ameyamaea chiangmaiensis NBRC 103196]